MNVNNFRVRFAKWGAIALAVLALLAYCRHASPFNKSSFDAVVWHGPHRDEDCARGAMIDDLKAKVLHRGEDIGRVTALLGKPDASRDRIASYYLGFCSTSFDPDTLDVAFNADGKITSVDIVTH